MLDNARHAAYAELKSIDPETGEAPRERLQDASSAVTLYHQMLDDDSKGSNNRRLVRELIDGFPPYNQSEREDNGQGELFNINTNRARMIIHQAVSGIMDLFAVDRNLLDIPLSNRLGEAERYKYRKCIESRFTEMLRSWDCFIPRMTNWAENLCADGVSSMFFEEKDSWKINSASLAETKFPRDTEPVASRVPYVMFTKTMTVGQLYEKIRNREYAEKKGWDVKQVIHSIRNAVPSKRTGWKNWEKLEEEIKANEQHVSATCDDVEVLFIAIQEFDGKVSTYMAPYYGTKANASRKKSINRGFLQACPHVYDSMNNFFQVFPYSTGTNNKLYTIRGVGYAIYQPCMAENIMVSNFLNAAKSGSVPQYQMSSTEEMEAAEIIDMGVGTLLPPGINMLENQKVADLTKNLVPALGMLDGIMDRNSGGLSRGVADGLGIGDRANKRQVSAYLAQLHTMNAFAIELTYPNLDRIYQEMVRRIKEGKDTPESKRMKKLLRDEDKVPEDIWNYVLVDEVKSHRIIGGGDKANRLDRLMTARELLFPEMDAQGRKMNSFSLATELMGKRAAEEQLGQVDKTRISSDQKIADMENWMLTQGAEIQPQDGEDHLEHLRVHIPFLLQGSEGINTGEVDLAEYVMSKMPVWRHAQTTLEMTVVDERFEPEIKGYKAQLQRLGEFFANGIKQIQAEQEQVQAEQGGEQQAPDPEEERKTVAFMNEEQRKDAETQAKIQRENQVAAAKVARETAVMDAKEAKKLQSQ